MRRRPSGKPQVRMCPLWAGRCKRGEREGLTPPKFTYWINYFSLQKQNLMWGLGRKVRNVYLAQWLLIRAEVTSWELFGMWGDVFLVVSMTRNHHWHLRVGCRDDKCPILCWTVPRNYPAHSAAVALLLWEILTELPLHVELIPPPPPPTYSTWDMKGQV